MVQQGSWSFTWNKKPILNASLWENASRGLLLFYRTGPWTDQDRETWLMLTGFQEATTRVLGDLARRVVPEGEAAVLAHSLARPEWLYDRDR